MRLIDADKLVETIVNTPSEVVRLHTYNILSSLAERQNEILDIVENSPTIEATPVVHGRWIEVRGRYICSECKSRASLHSGGIGQNLSHYCPNCGAKMEGGISDG